VANNATLTTGRFVEQLGNESSPLRNITATVNGPNWFSLDQTPSPSGAAASGTSIETGNNVNLFGPASETALGNSVPVVTFTSGLLLLHVVLPANGNPPYVDHFSLLGGKLVDGCALLRT
jgi:hypothetical protein